MSTENYGFPQYSYAQKGWDVGFNETLQTINDTVRTTEETRTAVDAQIAVNSSLLALNAASGYVPLGYNMAFDVWQRGASFTGSASAPVADLWWKNPTAVVTKLTSGSGEPGLYNCRLAKASGSSAEAFVWNSVPLPSKYHSSMRFFRNRALTFSMDVYCEFTSEACIAISDGVSTTFSSFHSTPSAWQRLTVNKTLSANASELRVECWVRGGTVDAWASFTDGACAVGTYTSLAYIPRPQQENELAARMMYQQISLGVGWTNRPATHSEKLSVVHSVPMVKTPDSIGIVKTAIEGGMTITASTASRFVTTLLGTGITTGVLNYVLSSPVTLSMQVDYCGVGHRSLQAGYEVT